MLILGGGKLKKGMKNNYQQMNEKKCITMSWNIQQKNWRKKKLKVKEAEVDKFSFQWHVHIERGMRHALGGEERCI